MLINSVKYKADRSSASLLTKVRKMVKGKKAITLFVDSNLYNQYKKFCSDKGLKMSKGFEFYMKSQLSSQDHNKDNIEKLITEKLRSILDIREARHG